MHVADEDHQVGDEGADDEDHLCDGAKFFKIKYGNEIGQTVLSVANVTLLHVLSNKVQVPEKHILIKHNERFGPISTILVVVEVILSNSVLTDILVPTKTSTKKSSCKRYKEHKSS